MALRPRVELQDILEKISGIKHAYYAPPTNLTMEYPCIRYELSSIFRRNADNIPYLGAKRYTLTLIDEDPDSPIMMAILQLPYCSFDRFYTADGLNHFVFTLYF